MQQNYHYKKNYVKRKKLENVNQKRHHYDETFKSSNAAGFLELCRKSSFKKLEENILQKFSPFTKPSKILNLTLYCIRFLGKISLINFIGQTIVNIKSKTFDNQLLLYFFINNCCLIYLIKLYLVSLFKVVYF